MDLKPKLLNMCSAPAGRQPHPHLAWDAVETPGPHMWQLGVLPVPHHFPAVLGGISSVPPPLLALGLLGVAAERPAWFSFFP
jgi:hypothetical protein